MASSTGHSDVSMVSDSECESVASKDSVNPVFSNEIKFLRHQNKRLREELDIYKGKVKNLQDENRDLKISKCAMQAKVEVEEEFITNSLLRQITLLKKNMESVASNFEREEECIVNELTRKLQKLQNEKERLEKSLIAEHEDKCQKLQRRIIKLEYDTKAKQRSLEQLRQEKIDIQNTLEQEQESLINRLWRNISQAEQDRRIITEKIGIISGPNSKLPTSTVSTRRRNSTPQHFSLNSEELSKMSLEELNSYVLDLQKELSSLQRKSSVLDPERYQKLLLECNIRDENHWIRKKFFSESDESASKCLSSQRGSSEPPLHTEFAGPPEHFKKPGSTPSRTLSEGSTTTSGNLTGAATTTSHQT